MKIYLASSWRNPFQPQVVATLRDEGHQVYDFRNPGSKEKGFSWSQIAEDWQTWTLKEFRSGIAHPVAQHAFGRDRDGLNWCDVCVLLLPSGMSAHLEAGWCAGKGKPVLVLAPEFRQAELMYGLFETAGFVPLHETVAELAASLKEIAYALR